MIDVQVKRLHILGEWQGWGPVRHPFYFMINDSNIPVGRILGLTIKERERIREQNNWSWNLRILWIDFYWMRGAMYQ